MRSCPALVAAAVAALAVLSLAGCGDAPPSGSARDGRLTIAQRDYRFDPQNATVPANRELRIDVVNRAQLPHTLRLVRNNRIYVRFTALLPGEAADKRVTLPPGSYKLVCALGNHEELGMYGAVRAR